MKTKVIAVLLLVGIVFAYGNNKEEVIKNVPETSVAGVEYILSTSNILF